MKKVLVIILLFVFQISFSQSGNVIIKGNLKSASGKMYLYEILGSESFLIDSTFVSNKTFQFKSRNFNSLVVSSLREKIKFSYFIK